LIFTQKAGFQGYFIEEKWGLHRKTIGKWRFHGKTIRKMLIYMEQMMKHRDFMGFCWLIDSQVGKTPLCFVAV